MKKFTFLLLSVLFIHFGRAQTSYTFNWVPTTISPGNNILNMNIYDDNSAVVAGLNGTFFKFDPKFQTWNVIPVMKGEYNFVDISINGNGVGFACSGKAKAVDNPSGGDPDVYANGALVKTTDNGDTWTLLDPASIGTGDDLSLNPSAAGCYEQNFYSVESVNDTTAYVGLSWYEYDAGSHTTHSTILKTSDGGATWDAITEDRGSHYPMSIESSDSTVYMGGNDFLLKTTAGSDTVTDLYPNMAAANSDSSIFVYNITVVSDTEMYVTSTTDGVFKTVDGGATFTKMNTLTGGFDFYKVNDSTYICLGTSTHSLISTDSGNTWESFYPGSTCYAIGGVLNDSLYGLGRSNVYKVALTDIASHTNTWVATTLSQDNNLRRMAVLSTDKAFIVGYGDTFLKTTDKGLNWTAAALPDLSQYGPQFDYNSISKNNGASYVSLRRYKLIDYPYSSGKDDIYINGLIYRSYDNWHTWTLLDLSKIGSGTDPSANPNVDGCYSTDAFTIESVDSSSAFVYLDWNDTTTGSRVYHSRVFKTMDGGSTWDTVTKDLGSNFVNEIKYISDTVVYILGNRTFLKTSVAGSTVTDLYPTLAVGTDSSLYLKHINYVSHDEFYVVSTSDGIFKTTDGGSTYTLLNGKTGGNGFYLVNDSTYITAYTTTKTLFSDNWGADWINCSPGTTLWNFGGVLNDSLVALAKSDIYKIALTDLLPQSPSGIHDIYSESPIKIAYQPSGIEVISPDKDIDKCMVYNITGKVVYIMTPAARSCFINYSSYAPGVYVVVTYVGNQMYTNKVLFR